MDQNTVNGQFKVKNRPDFFPIPLFLYKGQFLLVNFCQNLMVEYN